MAVNHYFQGGRGIGNDAEKRLHEDIIIESLKIFGQDIYYLPRTLVNRDLVLGEDTSSRFDDSYLLEMYFETNEGFAGENEIIKPHLPPPSRHKLCSALSFFSIVIRNTSHCLGKVNETIDLTFPPAGPAQTL